MAAPNAKAPLGQGGRFAAVEASAAASGANNPAAVAAAAGRKKYGKGRMQKMAANGRSDQAAMDAVSKRAKERGIKGFD